MDKDNSKQDCFKELQGKVFPRPRPQKGQSKEMLEALEKGVGESDTRYPKQEKLDILKMKIEAMNKRGTVRNQTKMD